MCIRKPIPPTITVLFDPDAVQQHPFDMDYESDAETIPWTLNGDATPHTPRDNFFGPTRGTTRVWADMADSDGESEPQQETAAQRSARRLEASRLASLQDIIIIDPFTYSTIMMETDGNTLVGEVLRFTAAGLGLNPNSFVIAYNEQPLTNSMDITSITETDVSMGRAVVFTVVRRPVSFNIEFRTVEHGTIRLSVQQTDSVASLYSRISFLTGWGVHYFTLRYDNHVLDNLHLDMFSLGIYGDAFMVMVGVLSGGTQRFNIGSPCAAAAIAGFDDSDISPIEMDVETESATSMPDMSRLSISDSIAVASSSPPSVRVGRCPPHQSSSPAASGSAGVGSSAAAPPWVPADSVSTLSVQGLKRTYADAREAAQGQAYQRSALPARFCSSHFAAHIRDFRISHSRFSQLTFEIFAAHIWF